MNTGRTDALLRAGLPAAAQRVAATNPELRRSLAYARALDTQAWKAAYAAGVSADDAEALASFAVDDSCIEHLLELREKRTRTLEAVLHTWWLTPDQQLRLAGLSLSQKTASSMLTLPWTTPEARALVARRAEGSVRLNWACRSSVGIISDEDAVAHVAAALSGKDEIDTYEAASSIGWLAESRPGCIDALFEIGGDTVLTGLSMANLAVVADGVGGIDASGQATLFGNVDSVAAPRWEALVVEAAARRHTTSIALNLLYRPEVPASVKEQVWDGLDDDRRAEARRSGVPDPRRGGVSGLDSRECTSSLEQLEWLISVRDDAWLNSAVPLVWYELCGADTLDGDTARCLSSHLAHLRWNSHQGELRLAAQQLLAQLHGVGVANPAAEHQLGERARILSEVRALESARRVGEGRQPWWHRSADESARYPNPAEIPMEGPKPRWGNAEPFHGRSDLAAAYFSQRFGDDAAAWEVLFGLIEGFDGTIGDLAESVALLGGLETVGS